MEKKTSKAKIKEIKLDLNDLKDEIMGKKVELQVTDVMKVLMDIAILTKSVEDNTKKDIKQGLSMIGQGLANLMAEEMKALAMSHLQKNPETKQPDEPKDLNYIG